MAIALPSPVELEIRDDQTIDCSFSKYTTPHGRKSTFKEYVDTVPDEEYNLDEDPAIGFQRSDSPPPGICIHLQQTAGPVASGSNIISMAKDGYKKCVEDGDNSRDGDTYFNFVVKNPGYTIIVGGGGCPGTFGIEGKPVYLS